MLRLGHVVEQELQNQSAAEAASFNFEIGKSHGQISVLNVINADEAGIFHRL